MDLKRRSFLVGAGATLVASLGAIFKLFERTIQNPPFAIKGRYAGVVTSDASSRHGDWVRDSSKVVESCSMKRYEPIHGLDCWFGFPSEPKEGMTFYNLQDGEVYCRADKKWIVVADADGNGKWFGMKT